jgi:transposase-like protein
VSLMQQTAARVRTCAHFQAEQAGPTQAALVRGSWVYSSRYRCPACGSYFTEHHTQTAPRSSS